MHCGILALVKYSLICLPWLWYVLMVIAVAFEIGEAQDATAALPVMLIAADRCKLLWL